MSLSKIHSYIQCRKSSYYFRRAIPRKVSQIINQSTLIISLQTQRKDVALSRAISCVLISDYFFGSVNMSNHHALTPAFRRDVARAMARFEESSLLATEAHLYTGTAARPGQLSEMIAVTDQYLTSPASFKLVEDGLIAELTDFAMLSVQPGPEDDPALARAFIQRSQMQAFRNLMAKTLALQVDPAFVAPHTDTPGSAYVLPSPSNPSSPDMRTAWAEYLAEKEGQLKEGTRIQYDAVVDEFTDDGFVGNKPVGSITREDLMAYRSILIKLPAMRKKLKPYRDKSVAELCRMDIPSTAKMSDRTINERLILLCSFFNWCHKVKNYQPRDITHDVLLKNVESAERAPFDKTDIAQLFSKEHYGSRLINAAFKFWFPLLGLYTGARISELAQLKPSDIRMKDGIPVLWVVHDTKTKAGRRFIPLHPVLIRIGLVRYAIQMAEAGHESLFPELTKTGRTYGDQASKWFTQYRRAAGVQDTDEAGKEKVFHSFRHLFVTKLRQLPGGVPDIALIQQIVGHEKDLFGATAIYTHEFPTEQCKAVVDRLEHEVDVEMLRARWEELKPV